MSFLEKYCPKTLTDYVGNNKLVKDLLKSINKNKKNGCYAITGAIGCGKTLLVKLFSKELKLKVMYVNPDSLTETELKKMFQKSFFKKIIFFDDIDLYREPLRKKIYAESLKSKSYSLCFFTSKDKLTKCKHIEQYKLRKLTDVQITKFIKKIIKNEKIKISKNKVDDIIVKIIKSSNYDVRNTIITLENLCNTDKAIKLSKNFNDEIKKTTINYDLELFDSFKIVLNKKSKLEKKEDVFYSNQFIISNLLYDNISNINNCSVEDLSYIYETFGEDDLIDTNIRTKQNYGLLPYKSMLVVSKPFVNIEMNHKINFPSSISKISTLNKNNKIIDNFLVSQKNNYKTEDLYYLNSIKNNKEIKSFTLLN